MVKKKKNVMIKKCPKFHISIYSHLSNCCHYYDRTDFF